jgi:hypothetical protein
MTKVATGMVFQPQQQILLYSSEQWEEFIREWVHYQKTKYQKVVMLAGGGDMGIDVAGLCDEKAFKGVWDNFQCKHYNDPLTPSIAAPEIGKIIWHSFQKQFEPPRKFYFNAPKGCGATLLPSLEIFWRTPAIFG